MKKILLIVETNWLESIALAQDKSSFYLLDLADTEKISIAIPEYSFYEADGSLYRKLLERVERLDKSMGSLKKIGESEHCADLCKEARDIIKRLKTIAFDDRYKIQPVLDELKTKVCVIPYTKDASLKAELRFKSSKPPFKDEDCKILESILEFVESERKKSEYDYIIFYTADKEDFDFDLIRDELAEKGVEVIFDSSLCVRKILSIIP
ncbi:MAG: PIN domain-containing protein [Methanosarcinales archaeon]